MTCRIPGILALSIALFAGQQEPQQQPKPDTLFAGTVIEYTAQKISVSRPAAGKKEQRTFRITSETKVEGKLRTKVRVTVRYTPDEGGDVANLIVVRPARK